MPGGVQGQVLGLARSLRTLGHQVRVLGPCDGPPPDVGVIPLGCSIPTKVNGSVAPFAPDPSCVFRTVAALRDERFDVLHLHEPLVPGPTVTTLVMDPGPMVGTFHASGRSWAYQWLQPLAHKLASRLSARAAVSEEARVMAAGAVGGTYVTLHNGIDIDVYAKATPWPTEGPTVLFLSRHEERKGLDVLLEAASSLPPEVRLWIASDGPDTARLKARYAFDTRIEWLGRINDAEKASRLRGADILCAPSLRGESFGVVLLEGMAAQTPVVASDISGYRNVAGGGSASLVPPGDPVALASAINSVLHDPALASRLSSSGDARAASFSMDGLAARYVELYEIAIRVRGRF